MVLAWYINRIARMSPLEIAHRVVEQTKRRMSRRKVFGWAYFVSDRRFQAIPSLRATFETMMSDAVREAIRAAADRLLAGEFAALGVTWPRRDRENLFPPTFWRLDPVSGELWPGADRFCFDIAYRHERDKGDIKFVWEVNRLQFLQPLAAAAVLFGDRAALAAVEDALTSWAAANPPFRGLGWNSGIELALRAVSIAIVLSLCGDDLKPETRRLSEQILEAHRYWIARYPSRFSSANNHLVAELMGEYLIEVGFYANKGNLLKRLEASLQREAGLQILADGTPAEQSPTYGAFSAEMLLLCASTAKALRRPLGTPVDQRLARYADFVAALSDGRGRVPAIGDDDEGHVITLCFPHEATYAASVARSIAGYLEQPTSIRKPTTAELRETFFPMPRMVTSPARGAERNGTIESFRDGGYSIVRTDCNGHHLHLVLDHGPLGYLAIAAHGHADANALILSVDDQPIFVDPGTYLYHSGGDWRSWFRGTRAHNTLALAGKDQSLITGPFNWGSRAKASLTAAAGGEDWSLSATHDGYKKRFGVDHRRRIAASPDGFDILDTLTPGGCKDEAEIVFQLAPDLDVRHQTLACTISRAGTDILTLAFGTPGRLVIESGGPGLSGGWVSPCFGAKIAAPRISWTGVIPDAGLETRVSCVSG